MKERITIYCKNTDSFKDFEIGTSLLDIYTAFGSPLKWPVMNARVNNKVEGLSYRCYFPKDVEFVDITDSSGMRTYVRSACMLLSKAVYDVLPCAKLYLEHPVANGYYCKVVNGKSLDEETILKIKSRMKELAAMDLPFKLRMCQTTEAVKIFEERGLYDKANLLKTSGPVYTSYQELDGYVDYYYGSLAASTGFINLFDLVPYADGLLMLTPCKNNPTELKREVNQDKMFDVFKEHLLLQRTLGMNYVGDLNLAIQKGYTSEVVKVAEAMQEKQIARIASEIATRYKEGVRMVLISGPSSSGKTTLCKRLEIQLLTNLLHPVSISLDDYFLNREDTPRDEDGDYDFESLYALDIPYFNNDLNRIIAGEEVELPTFNFETGQRMYKGKKIKLKANSILVIEGIHALNPELTAMIDNSYKYKIYVSALTTISLDSHNWIPTTDNRLIRRIVRDYRFRSYSAKDTIARWRSVRQGEEKWIFPYQENADAMFNSAMIYELAALRKYAEPILMEILESDKEYAEAFRLLRFLRYFNYIMDSELPSTSLLREFLGGSSFEY